MKKAHSPKPQPKAEPKAVEVNVTVEPDACGLIQAVTEEILHPTPTPEPAPVVPTVRRLRVKALRNGFWGHFGEKVWVVGDGEGCLPEKQAEKILADAKRNPGYAFEAEWVE